MLHNKEHGCGHRPGSARWAGMGITTEAVGAPI